MSPVCAARATFSNYRFFFGVPFSKQGNYYRFPVLFFGRSFSIREFFYRHRFCFVGVPFSELGNFTGYRFDSSECNR